MEKRRYLIKKDGEGEIFAGVKVTLVHESAYERGGDSSGAPARKGLQEN